MAKPKIEIVDQNSLAYRAADRGNSDYVAGRPAVCPEEFKATPEAQQAYFGGYDMAREHQIEKGR